MMEGTKDGLLTRTQGVLSLSFAMVLAYLAVGCTGDLGVELLPGEEADGGSWQGDHGDVSGSPLADLEDPECKFIGPYVLEPDKKWWSWVWFAEGADHVPAPESWNQVQFGTVERNTDGLFSFMEEEDSLYPNVVRAVCDMKDSGEIYWVLLRPATIEGQPHRQHDRVGVYPSTQIDDAWFFGWWGDYNEVDERIPLDDPIVMDALLFIGDRTGRESQLGWEEEFRCSIGKCEVGDYFPFAVWNDSTGVRSYATYALNNCSVDPETGELTCRDRQTPRGLP